MRNILLVAVLVVGFVGVVAQSGDIRQIDLRNFTYEPFCAGDDVETVTVKDGEFFEEKQMEGYTDRFYFKIFDIAYGDLNGDKKDEAVVLSVCNTGGTGNFSEGYIYTMNAGRAARIARIMGGDRAYGGLRSAKVVGGFLMVERNDPGENGGACCPEFILTEKYKLEGERLVEIGRAVQSDIYPKQRITFEKGKFGATLKTRIAAGELKRFVVAARAGQRLSVSTDSTVAELRLLEEARVTEGIHNFLAVLPKSGDYTIEVTNTSDKDIEITLNVKIQ